MCNIGIAFDAGLAQSDCLESITYGHIMVGIVLDNTSSGNV